MASFFINESKYSLDSRLSNTSKTVRMLLENFNGGISRLSDQMNTDILANMHKRGITYGIGNKKNAFIFMNFYKDFLSLNFYTGKEEIEGLTKANWIDGSDHKGSKTFRLSDDNTLEKALSFAWQSFKIKKRTISETNALHAQSGKSEKFNKQQSNDWRLNVAKQKEGRIGLSTKKIEENLFKMGIPYPLDFSPDQLERLHALALHNEWRSETSAEKNIDYKKIKKKLWKISKNCSKFESYSKLVKLYKTNLIDKGKKSINQNKIIKIQEIETKLKKMGIKYPQPINYLQLDRLYKLALFNEWYIENYPNYVPIYKLIKDELWNISYKKQSFFNAQNQIDKLYKSHITDRESSKLKKDIIQSKNNTNSYRAKEKSIKDTKKPIKDDQGKKGANKLKKIMKIVETDLECFQLEEGIVEGRKISRHINSYERNPKLRAKAISIHGTECMACGFDFEKFYGKRGFGFIEVHHIKPVSMLDKEVKVNPKDDLIVLCSNCHRMVHRKKNDVLTCEKLKELLKGT